MPINFSNTNMVWASILVETLHKLGLITAIICPGSRSAPLAIAFAEHPQIEAIPVLDERSAAFLALGLARRSGRPTVLVCTSGTAGANFYPAIIEAHESQVPLLVLTADRPPELRDCHAGQAIDQQKLYGHFPNWYSELALPSLEMHMLGYLRQTLIHAWERSLHPSSGPVHLNLPFREPLVPVVQAEAQTLATNWPSDFFEFITSQFAGAVESNPTANRRNPLFPTPFKAALPSPIESLIPEAWLQTSRGIIIAGLAQPRSPQAYCQAIAQLSKALQFPVLAEALSPLRNYAHLNPGLISTYDLMLRNPDWAEALAPDVVIRIGELPTSKQLRQWLAKIQPRQWIVDHSDRNTDPLHGKTIHLQIAVEQLATATQALTRQPEYAPDQRDLEEWSTGANSYYNQWCQFDHQLGKHLDQTLEDTQHLFEGKVAWLLSRCLPEKTPLFIANSTPVRDMEWFWRPGSLAIAPYFNRGANGIDGTLSTALGVAHRNQASVLLTGDLALLHDTNGFLFNQYFVGHLTIVLINNQGGGIFATLPIANFDPPFEQFFATSQSVNFPSLCQTYALQYIYVEDWCQFKQIVNNLPEEGIRVLEIKTNRKADAQWRQQYFAEWAFSSFKK
jgi:2-succinyl-5-enolpyruvyl-6-hydroxy-3-cyclohexene-1-carboxylate synthase